MTANAVCSLSLDPLLLLVCFDNTARTLPIVARGERFAVNVLRDRPGASSRACSPPSCPRREKFDGVAPHRARGHAGDRPARWRGSVCELRELIAGGDHTIAIGEVAALGLGEGDPLLWFRGALHDGARGTLTPRRRRLGGRQLGRSAARRSRAPPAPSPPARAGGSPARSALLGLVSPRCPAPTRARGRPAPSAPRRSAAARPRTTPRAAAARRGSAGLGVLRPVSRSTPPRAASITIAPGPARSSRQNHALGATRHQRQAPSPPAAAKSSVMSAADDARGRAVIAHAHPCERLARRKFALSNTCRTNR